MSRWQIHPCGWGNFPVVAPVVTALVVVPKRGATEARPLRLIVPTWRAPLRSACGKGKKGRFGVLTAIY